MFISSEGPAASVEDFENSENKEFSKKVPPGSRSISQKGSVQIQPIRNRRSSKKRALKTDMD